MDKRPGHFIKADIHSKEAKTGSAPLVTRDVQIKTTIRYYYTLMNTVTIKKSEHTEGWLGCKATGTFPHC